MKLLKVEKNKDGSVNTWESSIDVDASELEKYQEANLRYCNSDEIIFDAESDVESLLVKSYLMRNGISFQQWETGSRGCHFHTKWRGLSGMPLNERNDYRMIMFNKDTYLKQLGKRCMNAGNLTPLLVAKTELKDVHTYYTDTCMASEQQWIALENRPHLKSGKVKKLVFTNIANGTMVNKLDITLYNSIRKINIVVDECLNVEKEKTSFDNDTTLNDIKKRIKPSDLFKKWGYYNHKGNRHNPFWRHSDSKAGVQINDSQNNVYDYGEGKAYSLFTLVMMQHNCSFVESMERLKNGNY